MSKKRILGDEHRFETDDFFHEMERQAGERTEVVKEIELGRIRERENVRMNCEGIKEMAESIREKGLLQPITVMQVQGGYYEIIFGHRRFKGYCMLSEREPDKYLRIRAIVKESGRFDEDEIKEVQLVENIQRENLTAGELREAFVYLRGKGLTNKEIAHKIGKAEGYVKQVFSSIKTIEENPKLKELIQSDAGVTLADIQEVRPLPFKEQVSLIVEKIQGNIKTRAELRDRVRELKDSLYSAGKKHREKKLSFDVLVEKDTGFRVKAFEYDRGRTSAEGKRKLLSLLRDIITRLETETEVRS